MERREILRAAIQIAFGAQIALAAFGTTDYGYGPCDVCGEPANSSAVDMREIEPSGNWMRSEPIMESRRIRCPKHRAPSRMYYRMAS